MQLQKTLLHVGGLASRVSRYVPHLYCLVASARCDERRPRCRLECAWLFWSLVIAATPRKRCPKAGFVSPTCSYHRRSTLVFHQSTALVSTATVEALATVHASSLALQARSKPMIALIQASSLVATRKIVSTLDFRQPQARSGCLPQTWPRSEQDQARV